MADISDAALAEYLATGAWEGKAGAFGYQDGVPWIEVLGGKRVERGGAAAGNACPHAARPIRSVASSSRANVAVQFEAVRPASRKTAVMTRVGMTDMTQDARTHKKSPVL